MSMAHTAANAHHSCLSRTAALAGLHNLKPLFAGLLALQPQRKVEEDPVRQDEDEQHSDVRPPHAAQFGAVLEQDIVPGCRMCGIASGHADAVSEGRKAGVRRAGRVLINQETVERVLEVRQVVQPDPIAGDFVPGRGREQSHTIGRKRTRNDWRVQRFYESRNGRKAS
jgi:hypothetical protein